VARTESDHLEGRGSRVEGAALLFALDDGVALRELAHAMATQIRAISRDALGR
jgi:hypothetical protein